MHLEICFLTPDCRGFIFKLKSWSSNISSFFSSNNDQVLRLPIPWRIQQCRKVDCKQKARLTLLLLADFCLVYCLLFLSFLFSCLQSTVYTRFKAENATWHKSEENPLRLCILRHTIVIRLLLAFLYIVRRINVWIKFNLNYVHKTFGNPKKLKNCRNPGDFVRYPAAFNPS